MVTAKRQHQKMSETSPVTRGRETYRREVDVAGQSRNNVDNEYRRR